MRAFLFWPVLLGLARAQYSYEVVAQDHAAHTHDAPPERRSDARVLRLREAIVGRSVAQAEFFHNLSHKDELLNLMYVVRHLPNDASLPPEDQSDGVEAEIDPLQSDESCDDCEESCECDAHSFATSLYKREL